MYNVGTIVSVRGISQPVIITNIIRAAGMVGYEGQYEVNGTTMTISWIPLGLIRPF